MFMTCCKVNAKKNAGFYIWTFFKNTINVRLFETER